MASLGAAAVAGVTPAAAATIDGTATITNPSGGALTYPAASTQLFTIAPPPGAVCSGNTTGNSTKEYTYLEPSGTNIQNLTVSGGIIPPYGLFDDTPAVIDAVSVASDDVVPGLPNDLAWEPGATDYSIKSTLLTTGTWEAGIACATPSGITDYWNTQVTFTANGSDSNGFVWTAVPGDPNGGAAPEVPYAVILPLLAIAIVGGTVLVRRRRRSPAQVA
jgi:hypothetical protein